MNLEKIKQRVATLDKDDYWGADKREWPGNENLQHWVFSANQMGDGVGAFASKTDADFIAHARQDIPALIAEVERLQFIEQNAQCFIEETQQTNRVMNEFREDYFKLREKHFFTDLENKRLREALAFYAISENHENISYSQQYSKVAKDFGEKARQALGSE